LRREFHAAVGAKSDASLLHNLTQTKVGDFHSTGVVKQYVSRFQVVMNNALRAAAHVRQTIEHLGEDGARLSLADATLRLQASVEIISRAEL